MICLMLILVVSINPIGYAQTVAEIEFWQSVKDGDDIYYDKQAGFKLEVKKDIYKVIKEHDVVIVL